MLENFLPEKIYSGIKRYLNLVELNEIRLRANAPVIATMRNKKYYIGENGFSDRNHAIICDQMMLQDFIYKACENSIYSINDYLKSGFITLKNGIRIGLAGEVVSENGKIKTLKNFQSANIRIPHNVEGCSDYALSFMMGEKFLNTLVISPPGAGKTTFIRDVIYQLGKKNYSYNVLVCDERNEILNMVDGKASIPLSDFTDIYSYCSKEYAFKCGIRSMAPDIIVTDEIDIDKDLQTILDATNSGVKILATIHSENINQLRQKRGFDSILNNHLFDRYVVLSSKDGPGTLAAIYDQKLGCLFCR